MPHISPRFNQNHYIRYIAGLDLVSVFLGKQTHFGAYPQSRLGRNCGYAAARMGVAEVGACRCAPLSGCAAGLAVRDLHSVPSHLHDGRSQRQPGGTGDGEIETGRTAAFHDDQRFVDAGP